MNETTETAHLNTEAWKEYAKERNAVVRLISDKKKEYCRNFVKTADNRNLHEHLNYLIAVSPLSKLYPMTKLIQ